VYVAVYLPGSSLVVVVNYYPAVGDLHRQNIYNMVIQWIS